MKYTKDSLDKLLARVRQERISVQHGSPSDVEIAQAQLADMAGDYIPGLIETINELRADQMKQFEGGLSMKQFITRQGEELNAARARLATLEDEAAAAKAALLDLLREFYAGGQLATVYAPPFDKLPLKMLEGINFERQTNNDWVQFKARELGFPWPLPEDGYDGITAKATPPAPLAGEAGPAVRDATKPCTCGFLAQTVGDGCWKCNPECYEADPVPEYDDFILLATADEPVWVPSRATWDDLTDEGKRRMMEVADLKPYELKKTVAGAPLEREAAAETFGDEARQWENGGQYGG